MSKGQRRGTWDETISWHRPKSQLVFKRPKDRPQDNNNGARTGALPGSLLCKKHNLPSGVFLAPGANSNSGGGRRQLSPKLEKGTSEGPLKIFDSLKE